jgi:hypothetical protein
VPAARPAKSAKGPADHNVRAWPGALKSASRSMK